MGIPIGAKAWRRKFDATNKLGCNLNLSGEEARAIVEFMEMEELPNPASAVRMLLGAALSTYPEWGANAAGRRAAVIETRMWITQRIVEDLRALSAELEQNLEEGYAKVEEDAMEAASNKLLEGDDQ